MKRLIALSPIVAAAVLALALRIQRFAVEHTPPPADMDPVSITIDYPADGSIFPAEFPPPTFLWRDADDKATLWRIDISFTDGTEDIHTTAKGEPMRIGEIDLDCISKTNELPRLTEQQAATRIWTPDAAIWESIKNHSKGSSAKITISGFLHANSGQALSRGQVSISTSKDPVGAPIFYRDVPLMPSETQTGQIKPLPSEAIPLVKWRLRNVGESRSRVVMENLPMCANCHSFSRDGKTLGMDMDGLHRNKGMYTLTPVKPDTSVRKEYMIQWTTAGGRLKGDIRVGFLSQVSPDGHFVVTTINDRDILNTPRSPSSPAASPGTPSNYYVANFKDYRFLQVFYPTRGILSWYSRTTGILQPLPGADDPRFVQTNAVWSPDGKFLVFDRAEAEEPNPEGAPLAKFANDPNERQIQYDLYRIPFNEGKGGMPEPITGASRNGMSNTFPKVSPDGRWVVYVRCRNGLLMRPDSQLYIVPFTGGQARQMRCNTSLMNSWHSFSPNGRWLVFSSKSRSPYTQMYLTHIDEEGNDSPAILVENTTAANRAVNLPEFVNIPGDGLQKIGGPAIEYYRLFDRAMYLQKVGRYQESIVEWKKVLDISPDDVMAHNYLGLLLAQTGQKTEAATHFQEGREITLRQAIETNPRHAPSYNNLGLMLLKAGRVDEAIANFQIALELTPDFAPALCNLGGALEIQGKLDGALVQLRKALEIDAAYAPSHYYLGLALIARGETEEAIVHWQKAVSLDPDYPEVHCSLGSALYVQGKISEALAHWREGIRLRPNEVPTLQQASWVLATCPDASLRDGSEAMTLAVRAMRLADGKDPLLWDTLAAAYAETGRFTDAVLTARRALALSEPGGEQVEAIKGRIALYVSGKPYRETSVSGALGRPGSIQVIRTSLGFPTSLLK